MCTVCKEFESKRPTFALIKLFSYSDINRPTTEYDGKWYGYDIIQRFEDDNLAIDFARKNEIELR